MKMLKWTEKYSTLKYSVSNFQHWIKFYPKKILRMLKRPENIHLKTLYQILNIETNFTI